MLLEIYVEHMLQFFEWRHDLSSIFLKFYYFFLFFISRKNILRNCKCKFKQSSLKGNTEHILFCYEISRNQCLISFSQIIQCKEITYMKTTHNKQDKLFHCGFEHLYEQRNTTLMELNQYNTSRYVVKYKALSCLQDKYFWSFYLACSFTIYFCFKILPSIWNRFNVI